MERNSTNNHTFIVTILLSFVLFISLSGQGIVIPVFPLYLEKFSAGTFELGIIIGIYSLTGLMLSPLFGSIADNYGRKLLIVFGLLGFAIANLLYAMADSMLELYLFRIVEGATLAGIAPTVNAMAIDFVPEDQRGKYLGFINGSGFLGLILGPFFGGVLVDNGNYAFPFEVSAFIALIGMIVVFFILPSDKNEFQTKKKGVTINDNKKFDLSIKSWFIPGTFTLFFILMYIRFSGITSWTLIEPSVSFFLYDNDYSSTEVGVYFSMYGIAMLVGQTTLGGLSDKFGRKLLLNIGIFIYLLGFFCLLSTTNIWNFYLSGILNGIGLSLISPVILAILAEICTKKENRGKVMGIYYSVFHFSSITGPIIGGFLGELIGFQGVLYVSIGILVLGVSASFLVSIPKNIQSSFKKKGSITKSLS